MPRRSAGASRTGDSWSTPPARSMVLLTATGLAGALLAPGINRAQFAASLVSAIPACSEGSLAKPQGSRSASAHRYLGDGEKSTRFRGPKVFDDNNPTLDTIRGTAKLLSKRVCSEELIQTVREARYGKQPIPL